MSTIKVNTVTTRSGCTVTLGESGKTVALASGASQTGFGRTGTVNWDTTAKTTSFTAVSGNGYFVNTTSGAITVTLPAGSAGDIISLKDYAETWDTNNVTVTPNGSDKINGLNGNAILNTEDQSVTIVFVDSTKGWRAVQDSTSDVSGSDYITATGGTVVTNGDFKTHIFTSPGTFCVSAGGGPLASVEYFVVAGGGSGGTGRGGGGGAGGFRLYTTAPGSNSPLNHPSNSLPVTVQGYPVTVGGGGSAQTYTGSTQAGNNGSNSIFSTITSAGGGGGGGGPPGSTPSILSKDGGSGGGGNFNVPGDFGAGNTPPVSPPQGNNGSVSCSAAPSSPSDRHGGGGGGAGSSGGCGSNHENGGVGSYIADPLVGPTAPSYGTPGPESGTRYFAGGGGAGFEASGSGPGGTGGGGAGANTGNATAGTANTGGGGGATGENNPSSSGAGGSGIVMIRYRFQT